MYNKRKTIGCFDVPRLHVNYMIFHKQTSDERNRNNQINRNHCLCSTFLRSVYFHDGYLVALVPSIYWVLVPRYGGTETCPEIACLSPQSSTSNSSDVLSRLSQTHTPDLKLFPVSGCSWLHSRKQCGWYCCGGCSC